VVSGAASYYHKRQHAEKKMAGDPACYFCDDAETVDHLLFGCPIAKVIWGVIAICFGQKIRPNSYGQFWEWIPKALLGGR
jgi:hypothetical protein